jgi:hypothetical protein|tara:strand:- start:311 stop:592 length:282 start_codon:yes stop_codon:yes gene_type:complete
MSFRLFNVEFNGKDNFYPKHKLMSKVFEKVGKKFLKEWLKFGVDEKMIDDLGDVNQIYKWIKCYEDSDYKKLRNSGELEKEMDKIKTKNKKDE